ncbi:ricin-type beta-trefoil lectin domain protein [Dactylosporangium sp. CA-139066]|uniref:ricin-type beta-trefoil lectin domain protein n=1 Tax=Dactylosporangium sp. CA-139066 TaxID=3239930 RepID=UPI003D8CB682
MAGALLVVGLGTAPAWAQQQRQGPPDPSIPANDSARGLVYDGFKVGTGRCKGLFELKSVPGACTHGPDASFAGTDVKRSVAPLAESTNAAQAAAAANIVCDGDGQSGNRVQVLYIHGSGNADRYSQYLASIRTWTQGVDDIYSASAAQTGGVRHIRFVTDGSCNISVTDVAIDNGSLSDFGNSVNAIKAQGYNRTDRKYLMYVDATALCGVAYVTLDDRPGQDNANNSGASFSRVDSGCWGSGPAAHELTHAMGAVMSSSPNHTAYGHCTDDYDIMCYNDGPGTVLRVVCTDQAQDNRLDCNKDDYFNTNPPAGSYLATHWNTANNRFLLTSGGSGGGGIPAAAGTVTGPGGKCVDVSGDDTGGNGAAVQLWDCQSYAVDQHWTHNADGSLQTLGRCLDIVGNGTALGALVELWDCNGVGGQKWVQQADGSLRNPQSGRCLDSPNGATGNGTRLQIWDCNGSGAQKFAVNGGGTINGPGGKCVDVSGDDTAGNGGAVQLWDCQSNAVDQHWYHNTNNSLRTLGRCLDIVGNGTALGTQVQLWDCNGVGGQAWVQQADGSLRNPQSGRCLDSPNGATGNGTRLQIWDCNGSGAQKFALV